MKRISWKWAAMMLCVFAAFLVMLSGCDNENWEDEETQGWEEIEEEAEEESGNAAAEESPVQDRKDSDIEPVSLESDADSATILIYMNGSDLETKAGEASADISEMLASTVGDKVNVIIQTMGTREWQDYDISSETSQIYQVKKGELILLEDDLGQLDCTASSTLSDFIGYGKKHFPADRYMLVFWNHGGGPVYGFGYDEWQDEDSSLTLDEIQKALRENADIHFDLIGMDCCIMANLETCYILSPFCRYSVLSEDFESGLGWSYTDWMKLFEENPGISTPLLGKKIVDGIIDANENNQEEGGSSTIVLVNEGAVPDLVKKWTDYAYQNSDRLMGSNYSKLHKAIGRSFLESFLEAWADDESSVTMDDYYVSDMMSIVETVGKEGESTKNLRKSLKDCVAYFGHTSDKNELTGLAVSLPYGDRDYYDRLVDVYSGCGFDDDYIGWLEGFVSASGSDDYYDYSEFEDSWGGWGTYEEGWNAGDREEDSEDWEYDYDEKVWYLIEDGNVYLYDDETDTMFFYDEYEDQTYYYDEEEDDWYPVEE